jgi:GT2 family glycosyltransferase
VTPPSPIDRARTGIFISTCNRPAYTWRSLESLRHRLPGAGPAIFIVDDASTDFGQAALDALARLRAAHPRTRVFKNARNLGIARVVHQFVELAAIFGMQHLYVTDNDVRYGTGWFDELIACHDYFAAHHRRLVVSCLNVPRSDDLERPRGNERFVEKGSIGGVSWLASLDTMRELLTPDIVDNWDIRCLERLRALGGIVGCTRRSFVQHFGAHGLHSRGQHDRGVNFVG